MRPPLPLFFGLFLRGRVRRAPFEADSRRRRNLRAAWRRIRQDLTAESWRNGRSSPRIRLIRCAAAERVRSCCAGRSHGRRGQPAPHGPRLAHPSGFLILVGLRLFRRGARVTGQRAGRIGGGLIASMQIRSPLLLSSSLHALIYRSAYPLRDSVVNRFRHAIQLGLDAGSRSRRRTRRGRLRAHHKGHSRATAEQRMQSQSNHNAHRSLLSKPLAASAPEGQIAATPREPQRADHPKRERRRR